MEATASARYLRGSAQKARLVVDMIRGQDVNKALAILRFSTKRASTLIEKCVRSAIANANEAAEKANVAIDPDELWVKTAFVDRGPTKGRRRVRPAPQGRAYREQRHFCHVTILLSSDEAGENGKKEAGASTASKKAKRGGAAAAPRQKGGKKAETKKAAAPEVSEAPAKKAASKKSGAKKAASKAASKLGSALKRKKKTEKDEE